MKFFINNGDSLLVKRLKAIYLIPFVLLMYIPCAFFIGIREIGNPFLELMEELSSE